MFIFDTGIGGPHPEVDEHFGPQRRSLIGALAAEGIDPADVTGLASCHLHFDHCGGNALFPGRPVHVQEWEYHAAHEPDYSIPEWIDFPGARYELLDGEAEVAPGLRLVPTLGHVLGHQSLVAEVAGGPVVLAGQAERRGPNRLRGFRQSPARS